MEIATKFDRTDIGKTACYEVEGQDCYFNIYDVNEREQLFKLKLPNGETWVRAENTTYIPF